MPNQSKRLLDQVRDVLRLKHYSIRTEEAYVNWIKRYILFHHKRHPQEMDGAEIEAFLTHLAVDQKVAASTQNQALSALLFLYRDVLEKDLSGHTIDAVRARQPKRLPTVLTREEALSVIAALSGTNQFIARLLCGSGLRLMVLAICLPCRNPLGRPALEHSPPPSPRLQAPRPPGDDQRRPQRWPMGGNRPSPSRHILALSLGYSARGVAASPLLGYWATL